MRKGVVKALTSYAVETTFATRSMTAASAQESASSTASALGPAPEPLHDARVLPWNGTGLYAAYPMYFTNRGIEELEKEVRRGGGHL